MENPLAPMLEKLSMNFWEMAWIAVLMPINAAIPRAMMATVMLVRRTLDRMVRNASDNVSERFIP